MMYKVLVEHSAKADVASYFATRSETNPDALAQIYDDYVASIIPADSKILREELIACAWDVAQQWARGTNGGPTVIPHSYYVTSYIIEGGIEIGSEWSKDQSAPWLLDLTWSMKCQFDVRMRPKATVDDVAKWL